MGTGSFRNIFNMMSFPKIGSLVLKKVDSHTVNFFQDKTGLILPDYHLLIHHTSSNFSLT